MSTQEFTNLDPVTAVIHLSIDGYAAVAGPLVIGHYGESLELYLEQEGKRINVPGEHVTALIKQLKRAHRIAAEQAVTE